MLKPAFICMILLSTSAALPKHPHEVAQSTVRESASRSSSSRAHSKDLSGDNPHIESRSSSPKVPPKDKPKHVHKSASIITAPQRPPEFIPDAEVIKIIPYVEPVFSLEFEPEELLEPEPEPEPEFPEPELDFDPVVAWGGKSEPVAPPQGYATIIPDAEPEITHKIEKAHPPIPRVPLLLRKVSPPSGTS